MDRLCRRLLVLTMPAVLGLGLASAPARAAASPPLRELRVQQVGDAVYFHARFELPKGMTPGGDVRLVPQDGQAGNVCQRRPDNSPPGRRPDAEWVQRENAPPPPSGRAVAERGPAGVEGLEFVGRLKGTGEVKFLLIYPTEGRASRLDRFRPRGRPAPQRIDWAEAAVTLDFDKAKKVELPAEAGQRKNAPPSKPAEPGRPPADALQPPVRDDLEGLWAVARLDNFLRLQNEASGFGFYGFAAQATARTYKIPGVSGFAANSAWPQPLDERGRVGQGVFDTRLYETTTGAASGN